MLSIRTYEKYAGNPPGMYIDGRKSWSPGKSLWKVLQQHLQVESAPQREFV
jgi:serine/threonine-protein kinase HipA